MPISQVSLKLLINSQTKRVLFAEVGKDCVDFLFHILSLPIASVIRLLREQEMVGSLANLYESIENMNDSYIQPDQNKDALLKPLIIGTRASSVPLMLIDYEPTPQNLYSCPQYCTISYSDEKNALCTTCGRQMTSLIPYVAPPKVKEYEGGFVKGVVTYMVMDDLIVTPMSAISSITLLNKFNVKEVGSLQEKLVHIGMKEAVKLLKVSLHSKMVLTEVFLNEEIDDEDFNLQWIFGAV